MLSDGFDLPFAGLVLLWLIVIPCHRGEELVEICLVFYAFVCDWDAPSSGFASFSNVRASGLRRCTLLFGNFAPADPVLHLSSEKAFLDSESGMDITGLGTGVAMEGLAWM